MSGPMISLTAILSLVIAACSGGTSSDTSTNTAAQTTTTVATTVTTTAAGDTTTTAAGETTTTTPPAATTSTEGDAGEPLTLNSDGSYTIDWGALEGQVFFAPPASTSPDPLFHVHNDPASDGFFFSVEAYTTGYGLEWTGEIGDFAVDCSPAGTGICVHFDPDGPGSIGDLGTDFMVTGDVTVQQADADGFVAVFSNLMFSDGTTIPGPFTVSG